MEKEVIVVGAGLAGSEAAYQLAKRGIKVKLYEMKAKQKTPAHSKDYYSELVCSNSLGVTAWKMLWTYERRIKNFRFNVN